MAEHLKPVLTGNEREPLADNPLPVREAVASIRGRADRIHRVLNSPAAHPDVRARAKDELVALSREALALWGML